MNSLQKKLAAYLLEKAADEFSRNGCNDFNLIEEGNLTIEEAKEVQESLVKDNIIDSYNDNEYTQDWILMLWLSKKIKDDLEHGITVVRTRTKPIDEILGSDVPRGLSPDDVAIDSKQEFNTMMKVGCETVRAVLEHRIEEPTVELHREGGRAYTVTKPKRDLTKKSKFLSLVLRHNPKKIGLKLDAKGWADVSELCRLMPISREDLEEIVVSDEKGRYSFSCDGLRICANQGHSIDVDIELEEREPPEFLYHGTATRNLDSIWKDGIKSMSRNHVHLSTDKETAIKVGSRHGKPAVLKIKAKEMYAQGHEFWISRNGVWLVKYVPSKYFCS